MNTDKSNNNSTQDITKGIQFIDIFDLEDIQRIQDLFSDVTGVASLITYPDGIAITKPSNFCRLCQIVRETEKGLMNCIKSDALNCMSISPGMKLKPCLSAGLLETGFKITVDGIHLANWLIGQVKNEGINTQRILDYGKEIGADKEKFLEALNQVPVMSNEKLAKVSEMLFVIANEISEKAFINLQLKIQIIESGKIEEKIRQSEKRYKGLLENLSSGVVVHAPDTSIILNNSMATELLGLSTEQMKGKQANDYYWKFIDDFNAPLPFNEYPVNIIVATKKPLKNRLLGIQHNDKNDIVWVIVNGFPIFSQQGDLTEIIISLTDISERKKAETILQNERILLRTLIDNIPDAIYAKDLEGRKTLANKAEVEILGATSENEVIGKDDSFFYPKEYADKFLDSDQQVMQTGIPDLNREGFIIDGKGKKHWLLSSKLPLRDPDNHIVGVMGIGRNIEGRKLAEEALKKSESFLMEMQVIAQLGTYSFDIVSNKWTSSEVLDSIYGISSDYVRTFEGWIDIIHPEWQKIMNEYVKEIVIGEKNKFDKKYKIIRKSDNEERWVHGLGELVFNQDHLPISLIGTIQDITERVTAEDNLKSSQQKLKNFASHLQNVREEEKILLAREIHDELGQILIAIKIDLGMMKQNVLKSIKKADTENILTNFENIFGLVDNTLNTTRKIMTDLRPEVLYLVGFVEAVKLYVNQFKERHQITCLFENNVSDLNFNSQQSVALYRILQESLTNIVKHAKATHVRILLRIESGQLIMEVIDNGIGFKTSQKSKSNSYGLLGMKERVDLLEGILLITSIPDKGTTIKVEIPYQN